jgi:hypothetical protein
MRTFARPWSPRHTLAVGSLVAAALAAVAVPVSTQSLSPVVTVSGDHFNVAVGGGAAQPKFLLMLSYFGVFRAPGSARTGMPPRAGDGSSRHHSKSFQHHPRLGLLRSAALPQLDVVTGQGH